MGSNACSFLIVYLMIPLRPLICDILNGSRYECREEIALNVPIMRSTAEDDKAAVTIVATAIEEQQRKSNANG